MKETRFEWDADKDAENQSKHGVSFSLAQYAFADHNRVIAEDLAHSKSEPRYFCFGEVNGGHSHGPFYLSWRRYSHLWRRLLAEGKGNL